MNPSRPSPTIPTPLAYRNFRAFVRDFVEAKRQQDRKYSLAYYSRRLKASDGYLKLVLQGRRNLRLDLGFRLAGALGLSPSERTYFLALVQENQSAGAGLKRVLRAQLQDLAKDTMAYADDGELRAVFEDPLRWEIYTLVSVQDFRPDPAWIAKRLKSKYATPTAVEKAFRQLVESGSLKQNEAGRWTARNVVVPHRFRPDRAYRAALERALLHLSQGLVDSSYFDSLCVVTDLDQLAEIRAILEESKRRISKVLTSTSNARTHIAFVNTNLFLASN